LLIDSRFGIYTSTLRKIRLRIYLHDIIPSHFFADDDLVAFLRPLLCNRKCLALLLQNPCGEEKRRPNGLPYIQALSYRLLVVLKLNLSWLIVPHQQSFVPQGTDQIKPRLTKLHPDLFQCCPSVAKI
jgi:hypothetical protein